jgi:hypothetical protein
MIIRDWPWDVLSKRGMLRGWQGGVDGTDGLTEGERYLWEGLPDELKQVLEVLLKSDVWHKWFEVSDPSTFCDVDQSIIQETRRVFYGEGVSGQVVDAVIFMLCLMFRRSKCDSDFPRDSGLEHLSEEVAESFLSGKICAPEQTVVLWLFKYSVDCGSKSSAARLALIEAAIGGIRWAQRLLVESLFPSWQKHAESALRSLQSNVEFGFPYRMALENFDTPELAILEAKLLHGFGRHGDEDRAVNLVVDAAFDGYRPAWELLRSWADSGERRNVLNSLLEVGSRRSAALAKWPLGKAN